MVFNSLGGEIYFNAVHPFYYALKTTNDVIFTGRVQVFEESAIADRGSIQSMVPVENDEKIYFPGSF